MNFATPDAFVSATAPASVWHYQRVCAVPAIRVSHKSMLSSSYSCVAFLIARTSVPVSVPALVAICLLFSFSGVSCEDRIPADSHAGAADAATNTPWPHGEAAGGPNEVEFQDWGFILDAKRTAGSDDPAVPGKVDAEQAAKYADGELLQAATSIGLDASELAHSTALDREMFNYVAGIRTSADAAFLAGHADAEEDLHKQSFNSTTTYFRCRFLRTSSPGDADLRSVADFVVEKFLPLLRAETAANKVQAQVESTSSSDEDHVRALVAEAVSILRDPDFVFGRFGVRREVVANAIDAHKRKGAFPISFNHPFEKRAYELREETSAVNHDEPTPSIPDKTHLFALSVPHLRSSLVFSKRHSPLLQASSSSAGAEWASDDNRTERSSAATVTDGDLESGYHANYRDALFAFTHRKVGWDCARHLEIMANRALPLFVDPIHGSQHVRLPNCGRDTMAMYPKALFEKIEGDFYTPETVLRRQTAGGGGGRAARAADSTHFRPVSVYHEFGNWLAKWETLTQEMQLHLQGGSRDSVREGGERRRDGQAEEAPHEKGTITTSGSPAPSSFTRMVRNLTPRVVAKNQPHAPLRLMSRHRRLYRFYQREVNKWFVEHLTSRKVVEYMLLVTNNCPSERESVSETTVPSTPIATIQLPSAASKQANFVYSRMLRKFESSGSLSELSFPKAGTAKVKVSVVLEGLVRDALARKEKGEEGEGPNGYGMQYRTSGRSGALGRGRMKILYIDDRTSTLHQDYLATGVLAGLKQVFGKDVDVMYPVRTLYDWSSRSSAGVRQDQMSAPDASEYRRATREVAKFWSPGGNRDAFEYNAAGAAASAPAASPKSGVPTSNPQPLMEEALAAMQAFAVTTEGNVTNIDEDGLYPAVQQEILEYLQNVTPYVKVGGWYPFHHAPLFKLDDDKMSDHEKMFFQLTALLWEKVKHIFSFSADVGGGSAEIVKAGGSRSTSSERLHLLSRLFPWDRLLAIPSELLLRRNILRRIEARYYDVVVYGYQHRSTPYLGEVAEYYPANRILGVHGEDVFRENLHRDFSPYMTLFVRELGYEKYDEELPSARVKFRNRRRAEDRKRRLR